jgi:hypothetical protein
MKYFVIVILIIAAYIAGIYYENDRLVGEPDKTIAIFISKTAIENAEFQLKTNEKYIKLLKEQDYEKLEKEILKISKLYTEIRDDALTVCERVECNEAQNKLFMQGVSGK